MHVDTLERIALAGLILAPLAYFLAPFARLLAWPLMILGYGATTKGTSWGPATLASGALLWIVGHWSFVVRSGGMYRSRLARAVFDRTPLRVTLPGYWVLRRRRRDAQAVEDERERRRRGEVIDRSLEARVPRLR